MKFLSSDDIAGLPGNGHQVTVTVPTRVPSPDNNLIMAIAKAHLWLNDLTNGKANSIDELAHNYNEDRNEISRFLSLAHLAPDLVDKILKGMQPIDLTLKRGRRLLPLPNSWNEQRETLGFAKR